MLPDPAFPGFDRAFLATPQGRVAVDRGGSGPAVLLLHGFPQTRLMWRDVAPILAREFEVIAADLPGYGESDCPVAGDGSGRDDTATADADHAAMSKRALAATLVAAMAGAGMDRFAIVGHDRGGRVAYRAALDHPKAITRAAVLDVVPTFDAWDRADARFALAFWPFSLLAQPAPLPERLMTAAPEAMVDDALDNWDTPAETFPPDVRRAYADALRDPAHVHAICEEYRAAASIDRDHDKADLDAGRKITCPFLALWSGKGGLAKWYGDAGGPLGLWRRWAQDPIGCAVDGGHFFPEEDPVLTADLIARFLRGETEGFRAGATAPNPAPAAG